MSRDVKVICDVCSAVKNDGDAPWWDFQYSSMDFPLPGGGSMFKSGSWDLCNDCSKRAYEALVAAIGAPSASSDSDPLS